MTTDEKPRIKITYATLRADNEDLHTGFEAAVERVRAGFGTHYRTYVDGQWREGDATFDVRSPSVLAPPSPARLVICRYSTMSIRWNRRNDTAASTIARIANETIGTATMAKSRLTASPG